MKEVVPDSLVSSKLTSITATCQSLIDNIDQWIIVPDKNNIAINLKSSGYILEHAGKIERFALENRSAGYEVETLLKISSLAGQTALALSSNSIDSQLGEQMLTLRSLINQFRFSVHKTSPDLSSASLPPLSSEQSPIKQEEGILLKPENEYVSIDPEELESDVYFLEEPDLELKDLGSDVLTLDEDDSGIVLVDDAYLFDDNEIVFKDDDDSLLFSDEEQNESILLEDEELSLKTDDLFSRSETEPLSGPDLSSEDLLLASDEELEPLFKEPPSKPRRKGFFGFFG